MSDVPQNHPSSASGRAPICPVIGDRPDVLLVKLAMAVRGIADETYAPFGLRCAHTTVLQLLTQDGPRSQRVLGEELHIDRSTMVVLMDDLERDGLVERRPDSADRRAYAVHITDRGRARSAETEPAMLVAQERVFGPLAPAERAELTRLLLRLAQAGHLPGFTSLSK